MLASIYFHQGIRTNSWTELGTKLRARGVRNDPKEKTLRRAIQNLGGEGGSLKRDGGAGSF